METHPDEHLIFEGHPSWRSILSFYFKGLGLAIVLGGVGYLVNDGGGAALGAGAVLVVLVLVGLLKRISTTYSISNQRLHIRRGIIARKIQETRMERVQNVNINQGALQRILQIGTVDFDTAGTGDSDFSFAGVAQPEEVLVKVEQAQREYNDSMRQGQAAPPGPQHSV
jgi:uncharacterized membrane protein YdbT with pleckstrin-like domain